MITSEIVFGALAPQLHDQLSVPPSTVAAEQRLADAVCRLAIGGVLTEAEAYRVRSRLVKRICKNLNRDRKEQP